MTSERPEPVRWRELPGLDPQLRQALEPDLLGTPTARQLSDMVAQLERRIEVPSSAPPRSMRPLAKGAGSRKLAGLVLAAAAAALLLWVPASVVVNGRAAAIENDGDLSLHMALETGDALWVAPGGALRVESERPADRTLRLLRGATLFDVAKLGPGQRFTVHTPHARLRAVGTVFTVEVGGARTVLRVYEGAVRVAGVTVTAGRSWGSDDGVRDELGAGALHAEAQRAARARIRVAVRIDAPASSAVSAGDRRPEQEDGDARPASASPVFTVEVSEASSGAPPGEAQAAGTGQPASAEQTAKGVSRPRNRRARGAASAAQASSPTVVEIEVQAGPDAPATGGVQNGNVSIYPPPASQIPRLADVQAARQVRGQLGERGRYEAVRSLDPGALSQAMAQPSAAWADAVRQVYRLLGQGAYSDALARVDQALGAQRMPLLLWLRADALRALDRDEEAIQQYMAAALELRGQARARVGFRAAELALHALKRPARCLRLLDSTAADAAPSAIHEKALALRVEALLGLERYPEARAAASRYLTRHSTGPSAVAMRRLVGW